MKTRIFAVLLLGRILLVPAFGGEPKFSLAVKTSFYAPSSSTFNDSIRTLENGWLLEWGAAYFPYLNLDFSTRPLDELAGNVCGGTEIQYFLFKRFSIAAGVEYWRGTSRASVSRKGTFSSSGSSYALRLDQASEYTFRLIPILTTLRYHLAFGKFDIFAGAGAGYYLAGLRLKRNEKVQRDSFILDEQKSDAEWTGGAVAFHLNAGGEFFLSSRLAAGIDLRFVFGSVGPFTCRESSNAVEMDTELTFPDGNGSARPFRWEITGPSAGVFVRVMF